MMTKSQDNRKFISLGDLQGGKGLGQSNQIGLDTI